MWVSSEFKLFLDANDVDPVKSRVMVNAISKNPLCLHFNHIISEAILDKYYNKEWKTGIELVFKSKNSFYLTLNIS